MKENISMGVAVLAIVISIVAIASAAVIRPVSTIGASSISGNELADNSVTSSKVAPDTLTDDDISDNGISKIADNAITSDHITASSITLLDLSSEVIAAMTGVVDIVNNSITGAKIADGAITNVHISDSADIDPSKILGTAWTATNDGSDSGLDSDTVDGIGSNQFLRNDMSGTIAGDLIVNGNITHQAKTRYYTIPCYAFVGQTSDTPYSHYGMVLTNPDGEFALQRYHAPVNLPDGATITKITVRYEMPDANAVAYINLYKYRTTATNIVSIPLPQSDDYTNYETAVSETVNSNNAYWVYAGLNPNDYQWDIAVAWVCIEYTVTKSLP